MTGLKSFVKAKLQNNKAIAQNTGYLTIIECIKVFLPFVALPYIIRTIGVERYGMVAFSQTIVQYLSIVINFGLDISAVREVAIHRDNPLKLSNIVSSVFSVKLILFVMSLCLLFIGLIAVPFMSSHFLLMIFSFLTCLSDLLFPIWFFQGIEKMKYITIVRSTSILFYFTTVFIFIKQPSDYEYVALLQSLGNVLAGVVAFYCILRIEKISLMVPSMKMIWKTFSDALPFWFSRLSVVFNTNLAKTVSGLFLSMESVAAFDLAQKLSNAISIPTGMLSQAAYPHISRTQDNRFATKFLFVIAFTAFTISSIVFCASPILIWLFAGSEMQEAVGVLRVLCFFAFSTSMVIYLGTCMLLPFGYSKPFNTSVMLSTLVLCSFYGILHIFRWTTTIGFAVAIAFCDLFVLTYRAYYCYKYNLIKLRL